MKNKTIADKSAGLLSTLHEHEQEFFTLKEATRLLEANETAARKLLSNMVKRGLLMRIKDGLYHIIPYQAKAETYQPDRHLAAAHLVAPGEYYIGYYSALEIYSLITQPSSLEQVVVNKPFSKKQWKVKHITVQVIYHNDRHFFGSKNTWIDKFNRVWCSDLEKTFVDCLFKPKYAGGVVEIAKALHKSKTNLHYERLLEYCQRFDSQAVVKRLGYLMELLEMGEEILPRLHHKRTEAFAALDPALPPEGKWSNRWRIRENIDTETITSSLFT